MFVVIWIPDHSVVILDMLDGAGLDNVAITLSSPVLTLKLVSSIDLSCLQRWCKLTWLSVNKENDKEFLILIPVCLLSKLGQCSGKTIRNFSVFGLQKYKIYKQNLLNAARRMRCDFLSTICDFSFAKLSNETLILRVFMQSPDRRILMKILPRQIHRGQMLS